MNRLFDTSINVGLRQFYILGAAACIANLCGFLCNALIFGFDLSTFFCAGCVLIIFSATVWGIRSRHVKRAAYIIITLITFVEFPMLYYLYQTGTIVYMILSIVGIAMFFPTVTASVFCFLALLVDVCAVLFTYNYPLSDHKVTDMESLSATISSLIIVTFTVFMIAILLNIQQKKQEEEVKTLSEQLQAAADHDALTGLYNRRYLNRHLEKLIKEGKNDFYAALLDLDFFKQINDRYGHLFGDEVLVEFGKILQKNLPEGGIATRFGGEEFMLILPDISENEIRENLSRVRAEYKLFGKQTKNMDFTFSCGVEKFADGMEITALYSKADEKLYLAKENGRDCVFFHKAS